STAGALAGADLTPVHATDPVRLVLLLGLAVPGLLLLLRREPPRGNPRRPVLLALDAASLVGAVAALSTALAVETELAALQGPTQLSLVLGNVGAAAAVLALLSLHAGAVSGRLQLVACGLLVLGATDLILLGTGGSGQPAGALGHLVGVLLLAAGALRADAPAPTTTPRRVRRALLLLPYAPVSLALGKTGYDLFTSEASGDLPVRASMGLIALAFVRQALTLLENDDLLEAVASREQVMRRQSLEDPLTGLANRTLLLDRLQAALHTRRPGTEVCVLYIDLDDFKLINDTHGHDAGDRVLTEVAARMSRLCGPADTVARLGGDEFALLLVGAPDPDAVAQAVLEVLAAPVQVGARRFAVTASVGLVAVESAAETARTLLAHADIAMYTAKHGGKGRVAVVRGTDRALAARKVRIRELVAHPDLADFAVVYQPVVDLRTGVIRGVEALLRWHSPEVGDVPPDEFVHLAEQAGSVGLLGRHVLATTLADLAGWQRRYPQHRLAAGVNVSPVQLGDAELLPEALAGLARHGLSCDQLVLEITEQALVGDIDVAAAAVRAMRAAGLSVAIDDFGTGYSSLRYLDRFDADVLKVDRSFVAKLTAEGRSMDLVRSVIDLAGMLDLQTIAEGVETPEQLRILQAMGCDLAQGWLFSRAVDAQRFEQLLASGARFDVPAPLPAPRLDASWLEGAGVV
ncbi:MAG: hypothetical protein JWN57_2244, partial [Frankiales bacterium]|nr:hypothetical protein [Frankiales bacterium]